LNTNFIFNSLLYFDLQLISKENQLTQNHFYYRKTKYKKNDVIIRLCDKNVKDNLITFIRYILWMKMNLTSA